MSLEQNLANRYFKWLCAQVFVYPSERRDYVGALRILHDIPFYWTILLDDNRAGDALDHRKYGFLEEAQISDRIDQDWLQQWSEASPSVLEVLLGICLRWHLHFENTVEYYFSHLWVNLGFHTSQFKGTFISPSSEEIIRTAADNWMSRQFPPSGEGTPFPVHDRAVIKEGLNQMNIWDQMNAYSAEHFQ